VHHAASLEPAQLAGNGVVEVHRVAVAADRRVRRHIVFREAPALAQRVAYAQHRRRRRHGRRGGGGGADEGKDCPAAEAHRGCGGVDQCRSQDLECGYSKLLGLVWKPQFSKGFLFSQGKLVYFPLRK
jgi:hypothetical protein